MQLTTAVHVVIMLIANKVFVKFTIMKFKYISMLLAEYSTFRIDMMLQLKSGVVDSVITASGGCSSEMVKNSIVLIIK